jgi:hypothetical protein
MTPQQETREEALRAIVQLEILVDRLKALGPCPIEGYTALYLIRCELAEFVEGRLDRYTQRWSADLPPSKVDLPPCPRCGGTGKVGVVSPINPSGSDDGYCPSCRGEGVDSSAF